MGYIDKGDLLAASDLREDDVDLPTLGEGAKARVRGLPAAYSNQAQSAALEMVAGPHGEQTATVNTHKLSCLQVLHGLVEPKLDTLAEVEAFAEKCGPAFNAIVDKIDDLSGIDREAIEKANATFQARRHEAGGAPVGDEAANGSSGSDLDVRAGVGSGDVGR